jgi:hypothetical protein
MADERGTGIGSVSDEEIAAAIGEELPDRTAMSTVTSGCGPEEFGVAADAASGTIPPGHEPDPIPPGDEIPRGDEQQIQPFRPAPPEEAL